MLEMDAVPVLRVLWITFPMSLDEYLVDNSSAALEILALLRDGSAASGSASASPSAITTQQAVMAQRTSAD
jgi:hypothetical protein